MAFVFPFESPPTKEVELTTLYLEALFLKIVKAWTALEVRNGQKFSKLILTNVLALICLINRFQQIEGAAIRPRAYERHQTNKLKGRCNRGYLITWTRQQILYELVMK